MALHKIKDVYPDYSEQFGDHNVLSYSLYSGEDKVGSVDELLVDDEGRFRYLVVNTGAWIFGRKVLLPIGQAQFDYNNKRVYANGLSREQVENLPEYDADATVDYDYEERVRGVYRPATSTGSTGMGETPLGNTALDATAPRQEQTAARYDRDSYRYDDDADLYGLNRQDQQTLKLYEERLVADKTRRKTGEVTVNKQVDSETQRVSVPIEKERVVVERVTPTGKEVVSTAGTGAFEEGEVARMEVYEETPDIRKEAFVREEVQIRKEVDRETVDAEETVRRERLNVDKEGSPNVHE